MKRRQDGTLPHRLTPANQLNTSLDVAEGIRNYNEAVRTVNIRRFDNFEDADRADKMYYWNLTPEERLQMMCELCALRIVSRDDPSPRLARVYRIIELPRS